MVYGAHGVIAVDLVHLQWKARKISTTSDESKYPGMILKILLNLSDFRVYKGNRE